MCIPFHSPKTFYCISEQVGISDHRRGIIQYAAGAHQHCISGNTGGYAYVGARKSNAATYFTANIDIGGKGYDITFNRTSHGQPLRYRQEIPFNRSVIGNRITFYNKIIFMDFSGIDCRIVVCSQDDNRPCQQKDYKKYDHHTRMLSLHFIVLQYAWLIPFFLNCLEINTMIPANSENPTIIRIPPRY